MNLAGVLVRFGAAATIVGLFLFIAYPPIGFFLPFCGTVIMGYSWSLPRIRDHPLRAATVGVALAIPGTLWAVLAVQSEVGGCPGTYDCVPATDLVVDPIFLTGLAVIVSGVVLFWLSVVRWRTARSASIPGPRRTSSSR
jgi:hypothetical protein